MKDHCSNADCLAVRKAIVDRIREKASNGKPNYILLSGGIDSVAVLYALMECGLDYTVVNFKFADRTSVDTNSVSSLQDKIDFNAHYLEIVPDDEEAIKAAVNLCKKVFGRVRKVKCQTIYAMSQVKRIIPKDANVFCGYGGDDLFGYSRKEALLIARVGEESAEVLSHRMLPERLDEFRAVFNGMNYYSPYVDKPIQELVTQFTTKACNQKFPKSILVRAFDDYFKKYKNARKPIGLHKGSCEVEVFEELAVKHGFNSVLSYLNSLAKENVHE